MGQMERVWKVPEAGRLPCSTVPCRAAKGKDAVACLGHAAAEPSHSGTPMGDGTPTQNTGLPSRRLFHANRQTCSLRAQVYGQGGCLPTLNPDPQPHPALPQLLAPLVSSTQQPQGCGPRALPCSHWMPLFSDQLQEQPR